MNQIVYVKTRADLPDGIPGPVLYVDVETYGVPPNDALDTLTNKVRIVSVAGQHGPAYVFDLFFLGVEDVRPYLRTDAEWCGHNLTFDLSSLRRAGFEYPAAVFDTLTYSQVLMNGLDREVYGGHTLAECMLRYCDTVIEKEYGDSDWAQPIGWDQINYAGLDVLHLRPLRETLIQRTCKYGLEQVAELESAIVPALTEMALTGIRIDVTQWTKRSLDAEDKVKTLTAEMAAVFPRPDPLPHKKVRVKKDGRTPNAADVAFNGRVDERNERRAWNFASHIQLLAAMKKVGVTLPDTQYDTLVEHADEHSIIDVVLAFKDVEKEATTFGSDWLKHVRPDGRVHPNWRQLGAASGRMSCGRPNMQQLPRLGVRAGIVAAEGRVLVRADFSQIEARVAAKISGDETLTNLFVNNTGDIHRFTASRVLGKSEAEVTKDDRQIGKSLLFGLLFGMQPKSLRVYCRTNYGVKLTAEQAVEFRDKFFKVFPGLNTWHRQTRQSCDGRKDFRSMLGRRRLVFRTDVNKMGIALNTPVQSSAADMLKMAVRQLWLDRHKFPDAKLIALVHDEIMFEVPEGQAEDVASWLRATMIEAGNALLKTIPVDADVKISRNWG